MQKTLLLQYSDSKKFIWIDGINKTDTAIKEALKTPPIRPLWLKGSAYYSNRQCWGIPATSLVELQKFAARSNIELIWSNRNICGQKGPVEQPKLLLQPQPQPKPFSEDMTYDELMALQTFCNGFDSNNCNLEPLCRYDMQNNTCVERRDDEYVDPMPVAKKHKVAEIIDLTIPNINLSIADEPPSMGNLNELSEYFRKDKDSYEKFRGKYVWQWGWLLYLQEKLPNDTMCVWKGPVGSDGISYSWTDRGSHTKGLNVKSWVVDELRRCFKKGSRFVVGVMSMKVRNGYHANALIFDTKRKTLTRFEPHGSSTTAYDMDHLDREIMNWLRNSATLQEYKYVKPIDYCPTEGPQAKEGKAYFEKKMGNVWGKQRTIEAGGYCAAWSLLFLHYTLANPDASPNQIIEHMLAPTGDVLNLRIREYVAFIVNTVDPKWAVDENKKLLRINDFVKTVGLTKKLFGYIDQIKQTKLILVDTKSGKRIKVPIGNVVLLENLDKIRQTQQKFDKRK